MSLPPGPRMPAAVQTLNWIVRPEAFMRESAALYGEAFTVRLAQIGRLVFVWDPDELKRIFTADRGVLRAGEANFTLEPVLGEHSVLLLDGAEHLRQRKLMLPPFHGERLVRYEELMRGITDRVIDSWPIGRPFRLQPSMQDITLDVILRVIFGLEESARTEDVRRLLKRMMHVSTRPWALVPVLRDDRWPVGPYATFRRARDKVDAAIYRLIAERRRDPDLEERDDILSMLMLARDEDGQPMTDVELRDELMTLLLAGHETTATALAWAFERLLHTAGSFERVRDERYADAVVKETLRLRPPIPIVGRHVVEPFEVDGYEIPRGEFLAPCVYLTHRRPDLYPEPDEFRPERFLDRSPDTYGWIPFGGGIRRCLGASFAMFEMKVVLGAVASRAVLEPERAEAEPTRRRAIVLAPGRGARAVLMERREREPSGPLATAAA
ncbi:MAG TPA: cytochrome P450 [Thermoleophilaceae bacterium]